MVCNLCLGQKSHNQADFSMPVVSRSHTPVSPALGQDGDPGSCDTSSHISGLLGLSSLNNKNNSQTALASAFLVYCMDWNFPHNLKQWSSPWEDPLCSSKVVRVPASFSLC